MNKAKDRFSNYETICLQCGGTVYKPFKELTDVEISLIAEEFTGADGLDTVDFGRAILKKAQEK